MQIQTAVDRNSQKKKLIPKLAILRGPSGHHADVVITFGYFSSR